MTTMSSNGGINLRGELRGLWHRLRSSWHAGRRPFLAGLSTLLVAITAVAEHDSLIDPVLERLGVERAGLPVVTALVRLPLSLIMSAPSLPAWGALLQVFVFIALGELLCGWRKTLAVGLLAHAAATLSARIMIAIGSGPLSLPARYLQVRDTGPSAAVVGVAIYLMVRFRTRALLLVAVGVLVLEVVAVPNLAGREHLVAVTIGAGVAILDRRPRRESAPDPSARGGLSPFRGNPRARRPSAD